MMGKKYMKSDFCEFCDKGKTAFGFYYNADCLHYICVDCRKSTGFGRMLEVIKEFR